MHGPGASESQGEHRADGGRLHHRAESVVVVDPRVLSEAPENPTSLVPLKGTISPPLVSPDPLAGDDVSAGWTGHQIPGLVGEERHVLLPSRGASEVPTKRCGRKRVQICGSPGIIARARDRRVPAVRAP